MTLTLVLILIIALAANVFIFGTLTENTMPRDSVNLRTASAVLQEEQPTEGEPADVTSPAIPDNYVPLTISAQELHFGELILVNNDNAYVDSPAPTVVKTESPADVYTYKSSDYVILDTSIDLNPTVIQQLNNLFAAYKEVSGKANIMINAAYRSLELQEAIFAEKGADIAAKPGYSEHHSGYAFDLCIFEDGKGRTFADEEPYSWIPQNCAQYGFIRRYPEGKTGLTGITFEPWHFRYVGIPHAVYMTQNNLCLEEYLTQLKNYTFSGTHLPIDAGGRSYEVYYVPAGDASVTVYVPSDRPYTLSGNNVDGFIVTVDMTAQSVEPETGDSGETAGN